LQSALFIAKRSWLSELDFRVKLFFAVTVLALDYLVLSSLIATGLLFALVGALIVSAGLGREILLRFAKFFVLITVVSVFIQGIFHGGHTVILSFPQGIPLLAGRSILTLDGISFGIVVALRLLTVAIVFILMVASTPPTRIVQGLMKLGLPFKYATLITMIFRFYPVMAAEFVEIQQAQASRAFEVEKGPLLRRSMNFIPLMIPTLLSSLRKSTIIAIALEYRGYSLNTKRHFINYKTPGSRDALFLVFTIALLATTVALRVFTGHGV
jgi:energy-coupling factor transport system permease protein